jgi:hypothetical protein
MRSLLALLMLLAAAPALAQVHRWVDDKGTVHYSDSPPPAGVKSTTIDIDLKPAPPPAPDVNCASVRCQGERLDERIARREEAERQAAAERNAANPPVRGLEFRRYISIERGMSEGQLLGIAGQPDFVTDQGLASVPGTVQAGRRTRTSSTMAVAVRTYTYLPTPADPFITTITLAGGRVSEIERVRKF